jgi:hypothetical protein
VDLLLSGMNEITPEDRANLLNQSVATNRYSSHPDTEVLKRSGVESPYQEASEGLSRTHCETRELIEHHRQSVARWMMHCMDGSELLPGPSVARYGNDGKMKEKLDIGSYNLRVQLSQRGPIGSQSERKL